MLHGIECLAEAAQQKLPGGLRNSHSRVSGCTEVVATGLPGWVGVDELLDKHLSTTRTDGKTYSVILNAFRLTLCTG